jgi:hypothetical protein
MTHRPPPTPEELILAMLRDVLARQAEQMGLPRPAPPPPTAPSAAEAQRATAPAHPLPAEPKPPPAAEAPAAPKWTASPPAAGWRRTPAAPDEAGVTPLTPAEAAELAECEALAALPVTSNGLTRGLGWLVIVLLVIVALANLPLVSGRALLRPPPNQAPQVLYEGLLLKGSNLSIYVIDGGRRRLISSADAFDHYGYRWSAVTEVDDAFLRQIPEGQPIHVLLKCPDSSDLYLLQASEKRWVSDVAALETEGYSLESDVRVIPCSRLRGISDGLPFP